MDEKSSLRQLQEEFSRFLYTARPGPKEEAWIDHFVSVGAPAEIGPRLRIYRNNLSTSLCETLSDAYPITEAALTPEIFRKVARSYVYEHPSTRHNLQRYGEFFSEFPGLRAEAETHPYIVDLARLEWAWHGALDSEEDDPLRFEELDKTLQDNHPGRVTLGLRKSSKVLTTSYSVLKFWLETKGNEADPVTGGNTVTKSPRHLLIWKDQGQRRIQEIEKELWPVFSAVQKKMNLKEMSELPEVLGNPLLLRDCLQVMLIRRWLIR